MEVTQSTIVGALEAYPGFWVASDSHTQAYLIVFFMPIKTAELKNRLCCDLNFGLLLFLIGWFFYPFFLVDAAYRFFVLFSVGFKANL